MRFERLKRWISAAPSGIILALLAFASLLWAFVEIADEVAENEADTFGRAVMLAMRSGADGDRLIGPEWVHELARDVTALGGTAVLTFLVIAAAGYLWLRRARALSLLLLVSVSTGILLSQGLKSLFDRPRPDIVSHEAAVYTASFPSGHSMMAAITYLTLAVMLVRAQKRRAVRIYVLALAVFLVIAVGVSRVYLGVHWPTDVLAGWSLGAAWALLCGVIARWVVHLRGGPA